MVHTNLNKAICLFCNEMSFTQSTIKLLKKINQIKLITASKVSSLKIGRSSWKGKFEYMLPQQFVKVYV